MGFNKKWISNDQIHTLFAEGGVGAVKKQIESADAIIMENGLSSSILDILLETHTNTPEKWDNILQLIINDKHE